MAYKIKRQGTTKEDLRRVEMMKKLQAFRCNENKRKVVNKDEH